MQTLFIHIYMHFVILFNDYVSKFLTKFPAHVAQDFATIFYGLFYKKTDFIYT